MNHSGGMIWGEDRNLFGFHHYILKIKILNLPGERSLFRQIEKIAGEFS
ncbi:MAG TPA: hypothetical protein VK152_01575 [Paludibacter sp.]|nr:hypothetical protein [Paludibacter sp.]